MPDNARPQAGTDPVASLLQVCPDDEVNADLVDWSAAALVAGRDLVEVLDELLALGWDPAVAEASVESARVLTRGVRGVVTRSDVIDRLNGRGRHSESTLAMMCRGVGLLGFVSGLRAAVGNARRLSSMGGPRRPSPTGSDSPRR